MAPDGERVKQHWSYPVLGWVTTRERHLGIKVTLILINSSL